MKQQALFSSKDKSKKIKCRLHQFLFGVLRVSKNQYCFQIQLFLTYYTQNGQNSIEFWLF